MSTLKRTATKTLAGAERLYTKPELKNQQFEQAEEPLPSLELSSPPQQARILSLAEILKLVERLPESPGVYIMHDRQGEIVYVGKARNLRARVRQYFNGHDTRFFVPQLAHNLSDIKTMVTRTDKEALLLENTLIKQHKPRFNVKLRDDKQYLVLRLDPKANWPRLELVRRIRHDGAKYFGPYHSAARARQSLRVVTRYFKLRTCSDYALSHRQRPCLQYQIGRCPAPCVYEVDKKAYDQQVVHVGLFLSGRHKELIENLQAEMNAAAEALDFESAARLRDQIQALEISLESQQVVGTQAIDQDVIGLYRQGGQVEFVVLHVRQGKLMGNQSFSIRGMELPDPEVLHSFLSAYYDQQLFVPDEILLPFALAEDDDEPFLEWLRETKATSKSKIKIIVPERGERKKLLSLAERNAAANFVSRRNRHEDSELVLQRLMERFRLSRLPRVIECYDISHIQGSDVVASMVVFTDCLADKRRYRSFKIRGSEGNLRQGAFQNDDFASMYEVLHRRLKRGLEARNGETHEWALPDLLVIDGGKGQLHQAMTAMQDLGIPRGAEGIDVISLAKERDFARLPSAKKQAKIANTASVAADSDLRPERVFVPGRKDSIALRPGSSELFLLTQLRDEAHRFAISHHRKKRGKRALHSVLDDIPGVGPALKKTLLKHFGSVSAIKAADLSMLCAVKGIGPSLAQRIHHSLQRVET